MEKLARLFGLSVQYYETGNDLEKTRALLEFKIIAKELKETPDLFLELEDNLNMFCTGIMDKLKDQEFMISVEIGGKDEYDETV